ncbi:hypothetical protein BJX76DRAFT_288042 [Aspergillus varians]
MRRGRLNPLLEGPAQGKRGRGVRLCWGRISLMSRSRCYVGWCEARARQKARGLWIGVSDDHPGNMCRRECEAARCSRSGTVNARILRRKVISMAHGNEPKSSDGRDRAIGIGTRGVQSDVMHGLTATSSLCTVHLTHSSPDSSRHPATWHGDGAVVITQSSLGDGALRWWPWWEGATLSPDTTAPALMPCFVCLKVMRLEVETPGPINN